MHGSGPRTLGSIEREAGDRVGTTVIIPFGNVLCRRGMLRGARNMS